MHSARNIGLGHLLLPGLGIIDSAKSRLIVSRIEAGGNLVLLGEDDDGGFGSNSRIGLESKEGMRYRIEVYHPPAYEDWGGEVELIVSSGPSGRPANEKTKQEKLWSYWQAVE